MKLLMHSMFGFFALTLFLETVMSFKYVPKGVCETVIRVLIYEMKCCNENGATVCTFVNHGWLGPRIQPYVFKFLRAVNLMGPAPPDGWFWN